MIVIVKWKEHDRVYSIGLQKFLKQLHLEVTDEDITNAIKNLLEQRELENGEPQY